jgi:hypothetical protein
MHVTDRPPLAGTPGDGRGCGERLVASHAAAMPVLLRPANVPQPALDLRFEFGRPTECLVDVAARGGRC